MPSAGHDPNAFSREELAALLRDPTVSPRSIAAEMEEAGARPLPEEALARTRELLADPAGADPREVAALPEALFELVVETATATGAADLLVGLASQGDKAVVKAAKRALHVLRSRGIAVQAPRPPPAEPPPRPAEELPAYLSSAGGSGERVVFLPVAVRGGVDVAQLVISDVEGMVSAHLAPLGRKEYRRFVEGLSRASGVLVGEVPRSYARGLVSAALDLNARVNRPVPPDYNQIALLLGGRVAPSPSPGRALAPPPDEIALRGRGAGLVDLPELRSWLPEESVLRQLGARISEISVSPLYIDEAQRDSSVREAVDGTVRAYWTETRRRRAAERLFDLAYLLRGSGREDDAGLALATARALDADAPLEAIPFTHALFERVAGLLRKRDADQASPRGVILPG